MTMTKKVIVAIYRHKHRALRRVFADPRGAENWRREIAAEWWDTEIGDAIQRPDNDDEMADAYWQHMANDATEFFEYEECEVEP